MVYLSNSFGGSMKWHQHSSTLVKASWADDIIEGAKARKIMWQDREPQQREAVRNMMIPSKDTFPTTQMTSQWLPPLKSPTSS
jgi:hypothetical protein